MKEKTKMEKRIHLVVTYIERYSGRALSFYEGEYDSSKCLMKVSFCASHSGIGIPLWFPTKKDAQDYIEKAHSKTERELYVIQEFTYPSSALQNEAKIILRCKSNDWVSMADGKIERYSGAWANVRTISVCDEDAAEDYVRRFNEDAEAAYVLSHKVA
jgi:hypothetical protein